MIKVIEHNIEPPFEHIELNHLLKAAGLADSGGSGGYLVTTGIVAVDGRVELRKRNKIRPGQIVVAGDVEIHVLGPSKKGNPE
jgi:ribosome-associated protein